MIPFSRTAALGRTARAVLRRPSRRAGSHSRRLCAARHLREGVAKGSGGCAPGQDQALAHEDFPAYLTQDVYRIGYLLTSEQTHTQVQLLFAQALEDQGLAELAEAAGRDPDAAPILVAWSDNGSEMTAIDTRQFMALMAIAHTTAGPARPPIRRTSSRSSAT